MGCMLTLVCTCTDAGFAAHVHPRAPAATAGQSGRAGLAHAPAARQRPPVRAGAAGESGCPATPACLLGQQCASKPNNTALTRPEAVAEDASLSDAPLLLGCKPHMRCCRARPLRMWALAHSQMIIAPLHHAGGAGEPGGHAHGAPPPDICAARRPLRQWAHAHACGHALEVEAVAL